jgi:hypothetical protein
MKKKISLLLLVSLLSQITLAGKVHVLEEGETISKKLITEKYIPNKNHLKKIGFILEENKLDWELAKSLPIGFSFTVEFFNGSDILTIVPVVMPSKIYTSNGVNEIIMTANTVNFSKTKYKNKNLIVGGGSFFNHSKLNNNSGKRSIYSKMSQYVSASYILKKNRRNFRRVSIDFHNYLYENDTKMGVDTSTNRNTISINGEYRYLYNDKLSAGLGVSAKNISYFDVNSDAVTKFKSAGIASLTSNLELILRSQKYWDLSIGYNYHSGLQSDTFSNQKYNEVYIHSDISLLKRILRLKINYSENSFNISNDEYADRNLGVGVQYQVKI